MTNTITLKNVPPELHRKLKERPASPDCRHEACTCAGPTLQIHHAAATPWGLPVQQATSSIADPLRSHGSLPHTDAVSSQITIRNVPEEVRDRIKARAESRHQSMSAHIVCELEDRVRYPTKEEWLRLADEVRNMPGPPITNEMILEALHEGRGD